MLFTVADRDGRFQWRPRTLKAQILPHDEIDFSRVLDAWVTRGFVVKYRVKDAWYGCIPTFLKHQVINNREAKSDLPPISDADHVYQPLARVVDACPTREVHALGEGRKGRKGREGKEGISWAAEQPAPDPPDPDFSRLKLIYPKRGGSQRWPEARKAINARLAEGHTWQEIMDGTERYAVFIRATGKERTEHVQQVATFVGTNKSFLEPWDLPATKAEGRLNTNLTAAQEFMRRTEPKQ
ncbi:MAG TPA: hypothetical protein VGL45_09730 [Bradyrhizobium sp.]|jgi:hypothetical protein